MKKRFYWVDIAKGIGIICVVLNHFDYSSLYIQRIIAAFHMPLFFFLSGYVSKYNNEDTICDFSKKKIQRLIIPYIAFYLLWHEVSLQSLVRMSYGYGLDVLWFLLVLFEAQVLVFIIQRYVLNKYNYYIIVAIISFVVGLIIKKAFPNGTFWNLSSVFVAVFFILLGVHAKNRDWIKCKVLPQKILLVLLSFGVFVYFAEINIPNGRERVVVAESILGNSFYFVSAALLGIFIIIEVSIVIEQWLRDKIIYKILITLGQNSLLIMCVHYWYPRIIILELFKRMGYTSMLSMKGAIIATVISLLLSMFFVKLIRYMLDNIGKW